MVRFDVENCTTNYKWMVYENSFAIDINSTDNWKDWRKIGAIIKNYNTTSSLTDTSYENYIPYTKPFVSPRQRLRDMIKARQSPQIIIPTHRRYVKHASDEREIRARETLHTVLGDSKFRQFLTKGFVTIKANSGLVYQIFPAHQMTRVFDQGKHLETLCVVMEGDFAPTDSLIMRFLLILNDESEFRKIAISHRISQNCQQFCVEEQHVEESLALAFKRLKAQAA